MRSTVAVPSRRDRGIESRKRFVAEEVDVNEGL